MDFVGLNDDTFHCLAAESEKSLLRIDRLCLSFTSHPESSPISPIVGKTALADRYDGGRNHC